MNLEFFIAKRLVKGDNNSPKRSGTRPIIAIAIGGIVIGVAVMLISIAVLTGFQKEIQNKVIGFGGHIQITKFESKDGLEQIPIDRNQEFIGKLDHIDDVESISVFANKAGILKQDDAIQGIVLKGVDSTFNWNFFNSNMVEGVVPNYTSKRSDSVIISKTIAKEMGLSLNDKFIVYFIQDNKPRPRRFIISGIYNTGLADFDDLFILGDIQHIQKINGWSKEEVGGFEVNLKSFDAITEIDEALYRAIPYTFKTSTIQERHSDIFSWLELQDINVVIIILLIILVSAINMTSALLILILDRTPMIGLLKSMGANNWSIRKIFLYQAAVLISLGIFWGNVLGLGLGYLQKHYQLVKLSQESYYLTHVPVNFEWSYIVLLNIGTVVLCTALLIGPSYIVTKISPIKAIRFN